MMKGRKWIEVSCEVPTHVVDDLADYLLELSGNGVSVENLALDTFSLETVEESSRKTVKAYFSDGTDMERHLKMVADYLRRLAADDPDVAFTEPAVSIISEEDWANNWKENFKPARVGRNIVIKPTWEEYPRLAADLVIEIDPGMAFGTGTHATTKLCLEALEGIAGSAATGARPSAMSVLDVGTGSGILAVAAAKLGAASVLGIDIDPDAVQVANDNIRLNQAQQVARATSEPLETVGGHYDIVIANIIAEELVRLSDELARRVAPGGWLILSGILTEKEELVRQGFDRHRLQLAETAREGDWSCLTYRSSD